jgi:hypothetical protein
MYSSNDDSNLSEPRCDSDEGSHAPAVGAVDDVMRKIAAYCYITGTQPKTLLYFERRDGKPIIPGVYWNQPTLTEEEKELYRNFTQVVFRNTKKAVDRRRKIIPPDDPRHIDSLPLDFSILDIIRPLHRFYGNHPKLPDWTSEHYKSQFGMPASINPKHNHYALLCRAQIGEAEVVETDTVVDGNHVDIHAKVRTNQAGFIYTRVHNVYIHAMRVPRGRKSADQTYDTLNLSIVHDETSRPTSHILTPFSISDDQSKVFFNVITSSDHQVAYSKGRLRRLTDAAASGAVLDAEQTFLTSISQIPDETTSFCIEFENMKFMPKVFQDEDEEFIEHFPSGIDVKHYFQSGRGVDPQKISAPFAVSGWDAVLAIDGRADDLRPKKTQEEYIAEQMRRLKFSGVYVYHLSSTLVC